MNDLPVLYHRARTGALHSWAVWTEGDVIRTEHGQVDGQKIVSSKTATPKNIGRSNETTGEQQALIEAAAMHKFKLDRKYSLTPEAAKEDVLLPMLAQPFEKQEKKLQYPLDVQPKLDGVRALARWEGDKVVLISRSGKPWLVTTHLNEQLEKLMPKGTVLDGEIYLHGKPFQWITARTKKRQPGTEDLEFHVYDIPEHDGDDSRPWEDRRGALENLDLWSFATHIKLVDQTTIASPGLVKFVHDGYVGEGYEGLIVRTLDGIYEYGHRSPSLLKVKSFDDAEYAIVGHTAEVVDRKNSDGTDNKMNAVIWTCKDAATGKTFYTRPRGTYEDRQKLYEEGSKHYGSMLKVRYFGLTDDGLPRFPIGIGIRAQEDIS